MQSFPQGAETNLSVTHEVPIFRRGDSFYTVTSWSEQGMTGSEFLDVGNLFLQQNPFRFRKASQSECVTLA